MPPHNANHLGDSSNSNSYRPISLDLKGLVRGIMKILTKLNDDNKEEWNEMHMSLQHKMGTISWRTTPLACLMGHTLMCL